MRKSFGLISAFALIYFISGCKEIDPPIVYGSGPHTIDTSYMASVEAPAARNVYIEEFTGVSCPNCPEGHAILASLQSTYGSRVVEAGLYIYGPPQTAPNPLTKQDFRDSAAYLIGQQIYGGIGSLPSAGIDRINYSTGRAIDRSLWTSTVGTRLAVASPVNLYLTSAYDTAAKTATIILKAAFTQSLGKVKLNIGIKEDGIVEAQDDGINLDTFYVQNHVLRDMVTTPATGMPFFDSVATKAPGRVCQSQFTYKVTNPLWKTDNCKVFAFITDSTQQVLQAVETSLTGH